MKRLNSLHYLRGIAALFVLLYHITLSVQTNFLWGFFGFGGIGVDFFFVLSGFLMTYVHSKDRGNKKKILPFFKKRFLRIFPTYWIIVSLIILLTLFISWLPKIHALTPLFLTQTFTLYPHDNRIISATWTLSIEIYFYFIFGFMLLIKSYRNFLITFLAYILFTFSFSHFAFSSTNNYLHFVLQHRYLEDILSPYLGEFFLGAVTAWLFLTKRFQNFLQKNISVCLSVLLTFSVIWYFSQHIHIAENHRVIYIGLPIAYLILTLTTLEKKGKIKENKIGLFFGDISYSLYLFHFFILTVISRIFVNFPIFHKFPIFISLLCIAFSISIAGMFNIWIEKPLLVFLRNIKTNKQNYSLERLKFIYSFWR